MKSTLSILMSAALSVPALADFDVQTHDGRIEIHDGGRRVFGWQAELLQEPKGGADFAGSAFLHPLCTPSGFELTMVQPDDHLHHFGVWWPWKLVSVGGKDYVTWEMQKKEGQHLAVAAKVVKRGADEVVIEASNQTLIRPDGGAGMPVLDEQVRLRFFRMSEDAYALDIHLTQTPVEGVEVTVTNYRYSGFSWRGAACWNKDNSLMRTSSGHGRDNANHQAANWVIVEGATPGGRASMVLMSGAAKDGGQAERLRVWGSRQFNGTPFVNFNPVVKESVALKPGNRAVAERWYRLVMADRAITPAEADAWWSAWSKG